MHLTNSPRMTTVLEVAIVAGIGSISVSFSGVVRGRDYFTSFVIYVVL